MTETSKLVDSAKITEEVAKGGNLQVYWNTLKSNPMKIVIGVWESLCEVGMGRYRCGDLPTSIHVA